MYVDQFIFQATSVHICTDVNLYKNNRLENLPLDTHQHKVLMDNGEFPK